ncbi:MAG: 4-hydroxythreonine-4-phosphate dehydrogenase PdxA [Ignavibacteriaceae bacterium]|nr:4-hydroxythreonine-4-phosphate dehydrogenase PdxA [Ignavibacteriaceae bacterium]
MSNFVFTCGDINGIGPEIVVKTLNKITKGSKDEFVFVCPKNIFKYAAKIIKPEFEYSVSDKTGSRNKKQVLILNTGTYKQNTGAPTIDSGMSSFDSIEASFQLLKDRYSDAVITAPISKTAIKMAGKNFPGHTEMFAGWCNVDNFVMMFLSGRMNAALATIHEPIKKVPGLITKRLLNKKIDVIFNTLKRDLRISSPRIAVLGLNPHAGENGLIGSEEEKILKPFIFQSKFSEYLSGPFSPDAFFANRLYKNFDLVFGMYHDQVLSPFKLINFGSGVNFTAGLPIVRTSPDHGTAFDIAGKGTADASSMISAFNYAKRIVKNRKLNK